MITNLLKEISKCTESNSADVAGLPSLERKLARLEEELVHARQENKQLREKASTSTDSHLHQLEGVEESKVKSSLIRATRDVVSGICSTKL